MDKQTIMMLLLYVIIASTLINVLVFGNKKLLANSKAQKIIRRVFIAGIVLLFITLVTFFSV